MTYDRAVELIAAIAAILTAVVAVWAYGQYRYERREKRRQLERFLKEEKMRGDGRIYRRAFGGAHGTTARTEI